MKLKLFHVGEKLCREEVDIMASGSYFTIYRKKANVKIDEDKLIALKNEYFLTNSNDGLMSSNKTKEDLKDDIPLLMDLEYKHNDLHDNDNDIYIDRDGIEYIKLLKFNFCSTFSCLKKHFNLNAYSFKQSSKIISRAEAYKMLQAIKYVLSEEYSKKMEDILDNEYIELFGDDYSIFVNRFDSPIKPLYIDKESANSWKVSYGDDGYDDEISECDKDALFNLKKTRICLEAFLEASEDVYGKDCLVLEYTAW